MTRTRLASALPLAVLLACAPRNAPPSTTPNLINMTVTGQNIRTRNVDLRHESSVGQRTVAASIPDVWAVLPGVFAQLEIETTQIDSSEGVIGNPSFRPRRIEGERLSRFLDCGRAFGREYADAYAVTLGVLVQLAPSADDGTIVMTVLDAYARDPSQGSNSVHCITWGSLERRIGDLVVERLAS